VVGPETTVEVLRGDDAVLRVTSAGNSVGSYEEIHTGQTKVRQRASYISEYRRPYGNGRLLSISAVHRVHTQRVWFPIPR